MASDYYLVAANFKMKLKVRCCPKSICIRFDLDKLRNQKLSQVFQTQIGGKVAALNLVDCKRDTIVNDINEGLLVTVEEVPGGNRENPDLNNYEQNFGPM